MKCLYNTFHGSTRIAKKFRLSKDLNAVTRNALIKMFSASSRERYRVFLRNSVPALRNLSETQLKTVILRQQIKPIYEKYNTILIYSCQAYEKILFNY